MKTINYYIKNIYGKPVKYVVDRDIAGAIMRISGGKVTLTDDIIIGLERLEYNFEQVIEPTA